MAVLLDGVRSVGLWPIPIVHGNLQLAVIRGNWKSGPNDNNGRASGRRLADATDRYLSGADAQVTRVIDGRVAELGRFRP